MPTITIEQLIQLYAAVTNDTSCDPYEYYRFMEDMAPKLKELLGDSFNEGEYLKQIEPYDPWKH